MAAAASIGAKLCPTVVWISTTLAEPALACRRASCIAAAEFTFPLYPEPKLSMPGPPHQHRSYSQRLSQDRPIGSTSRGLVRNAAFGASRHSAAIRNLVVGKADIDQAEPIKLDL